MLMKDTQSLVAGTWFSSPATKREAEGRSAHENFADGRSSRCRILVGRIAFERLCLRGRHQVERSAIPGSHDDCDAGSHGNSDPNPNKDCNANPDHDNDANPDHDNDASPNHDHDADSDRHADFNTGLRDRIPSDKYSQ